MNLEEKAIAVQRVLHELDAEIAKFQSWSKLNCAYGCGKCCFKPDIESTPLEFLPLAIKIYKEGKLEAWLDKFDQNPDEKICMVLDPGQLGQGLCSEYEVRGMICRLFGYSARINKYQKKELITCNIIKTEQVDNFNAAVEGLNQGSEVPIVTDFYSKLYDVDPVMANDFMPINKSIHRALELVWQYYNYRKQDS